MRCRSAGLYGDKFERGPRAACAEHEAARVREGRLCFLLRAPALAVSLSSSAAVSKRL